MYRLILLLIISWVIFSCGSEQIINTNQYLMPVKIAGKYGSVDEDGQIVIYPQFDYAYDFENGFAPVHIEDKMGLIDSTGQFIVEPRFQSVYGFSENGLAPASILVEDQEKYGFIDTAGHFIIEPVFDFVNSFSEGYALVFNDSTRKYGFIDESGNLAIDIKFNGAYDFKNGFAVVRTDNGTGIINISGKIILERDDDIYSFSEGLAAFKSNNSWGFINESNEVAIEAKYDKTLFGFSDGLCGVCIDKKWGFIDKKGNTIIAPQFDHVRSFSEGKAAVCFGGELYYPRIPEGPVKDGKWGYIDKSGKIIIEPQFSYCDRFNKDRAYIIIGGWSGPNGGIYGGMRGYVSKNGIIKLIEPQISNPFGYDKPGGLHPVKINTKYGFIDQDSNIIIEPQYEWASSFRGGFARIKLANEKYPYNYIDGRGNKISGIDFEQCRDFSEGMAAIGDSMGNAQTWGLKWGFINYSGDQTILLIYDEVGDFHNGRAKVIAGDKYGFIDKGGRLIDDKMYDLDSDYQ